MKRKYYKPSMNIEVFEASEYIAACYVTVSGCNVNTGLNSVIFKDDNGLPGYQDKVTWKKGKRYQKDSYAERIYNRGCNEQITFVNKEPSPNYMYDSNGALPGGEVFPVYRWKDHLVRAEGEWFKRVKPGSAVAS